MTVLAVILAAFVLLLVVPVGVTAEYDQLGGRITAYVGPVPIRLYPRTGTQTDVPKSKDAAKKSDQPEGKRGGSVAFFRELLGLGLEALGWFRRRLLMKELTLYLTIGAQGREPAQWGMLYGGAWAGIGTITPLLENVFRIKKRDIQVFLDESTGEYTVYGRGKFRLLLGELLYLLLHYGLRGLKIYRNQKGSNEHGTSHQ